MTTAPRIDTGTPSPARVGARLHDNGCRVAIKWMHAELAQCQELRERFLDEGYLANHVDHPGVVPALDEGTTEDGGLFLVLELVQGRGLGEIGEGGEGVLSLQHVLRVADGVLDILRAAHEKGIVHRDVKPDNIFIDDHGQVRLLDFRIARMDHSRRRSKTAVGSAMGTPAFDPLAARK